MVEALRVMSQTRTRLHNSVVFLFNGGEESLQDASHLFITKHPVRKSWVPLGYTVLAREYSDDQYRLGFAVSSTSKRVARTGRRFFFKRLTKK
jgi:hypothetical protein